MIEVAIATPEHLEGFEPLNGLPEEYMTVDAVAGGGIDEAIAFLENGKALAILGQREDGAMWLVPSISLAKRPALFARTAKKVCEVWANERGPFWIGVIRGNHKAEALVKFLKFVKIDEVENVLIFSYGGKNGRPD